MLSPTTQPLPAGTVRGNEIVASLEEVAHVCQRRCGTVLQYQHILKCDHFPSGRNTNLAEQYDATPNFRQIGNQPVFGCGQPLASGINEIVSRTTRDGATSVAWFNMRQEPMIYINDRPYCTKLRASPFGNKELPGISPDTVASLEVTLKQEILAEAAAHGGRVLLHGETMPENSTEVAAWGEVYAYWEPVDATTVLTLQEAYERAAADAPVPLTLHRVPVTDEKKPEPHDFDQLVRCVDVSPDANESMVFNCQLGRGRTTTGCVIACLLRGMAKRSGGGPPAQPPPPAEHAGALWEKDLLRAFFTASGPESKGMVDAHIDQCSHMQNIRDAIDERYRKALKRADKGHTLVKRVYAHELTPRDAPADAENAEQSAIDEAMRRAFVRVGAVFESVHAEYLITFRYLERYLFLVAFANYALASWGEAGLRDATPFAHWLGAHDMHRDFYVMVDAIQQSLC